MQHPISILLVDDEPRNVVALEAALARVDCSLVKAYSGWEALECVLAQDFAVILLDLHMPEMDGFETARLIRARRKSRSTPIIFLTADDRVGAQVREGYRLGAIDYLFKPFDADILRAKVAIFVELFRKTVALENRTAELSVMADELERSKEHFRALIENALDLTLIVERTGVVRYANPSVARTLGYAGEQISGEMLAVFLHPDDAPALKADIDRLVKTGVANPPTGCRWRHADGSYRVLESTTINLLTTPSVAGLVVQARDVTERDYAEKQVQVLNAELQALNAELERRVIERTGALEVAIGELEREATQRKLAEETLDEAEQRLKAVVNNAPVILFAVDRQGIFTLFEGLGLKALGMESSQIVGQSALLDTEASLSTFLGGARLIRAPDVYRALAGETFCVVVEASASVFELHYSPNLSSDGALVGAIGIAVDVSERRALDARKDAFVSTVSHELRTPLNGIIAVGQLLLSTALDATQQEYAEIIYRSGQALHRLVDDVLTLARYESGKVAVEELDLDVRLALEDVTSLLHSSAHDKGVELVAQIDHGVPRGLRGDAGRLRQVLLNLAGNALKFTDAGCVILRAKLEPERAAGTFVRFEISDTGIGIASEVQTRLFHPFEQADSTTTTRFGGTGLGLAICRQLVESMGGRIGLESAPGSGSTFWFVLPLRRDDSIDMVGRVDLRGLRVLLVCDAPPQATAMRELVGAWSMLATTVSSAAEATMVVNSGIAGGEAFDALVINLDDAVEAGVGLARTLNEVGRHVILVAPPDELKRISTVEPGFSIIPRPVRSSQLFHALAQILGTDIQQSESAPVTLDVLAVPPGSGERVLVVEDSPTNQLVARRVLARLGYWPVIAEGGLAALEQLGESDFAVVLMDCRMPGMDGFEATRLIRLREATTSLRRMPIIAVTANAEDGDRVSCLAAGMDDYLTKPLDVDTLAHMLRRWTTGLDQSLAAADG